MKSESRWVQACITSVSFPRSLVDTVAMAQKNRGGDQWLSDMDSLLHFTSVDTYSWTAPKWLMDGDVMFFYHTKKAQQLTRSLTRQALDIKNAGLQGGRFWFGTEDFEYHLDSDQMDQLLLLLARSRDLADTLGGTIFACGIAGGASQMEKEGEERLHFRSTIFAPLAAVYTFSHPFAPSETSAQVEIGQNTITPLFEADYELFLAQLRRQGDLPELLDRTRAGSLGFRGVSAENWDTVSCQPQTRFLDEAQIRSYWLDHLLNAIKDSGTPIRVECQCFRDSQSTGFVDYVIILNGKPVPVEAKLNILAESNLLGQIAKYVDVDRFVSTRGQTQLETLVTSRSSKCIVIDQTGMFVIGNGEFLACKSHEPLFTREELHRHSVERVRAMLNELLA